MSYSPQRFRLLTPAVRHLLIINVIMFMATIVLERYGGMMGLKITNMLALWSFDSGQFRIWQPITYMFMHGGFDHIFFNMFALWMFGYTLEGYWGTNRFLRYYFVCGIGAALVNLLVVHGYHPTVGASGAIYGLLLAFGMMFPNEYIYLYFLVPIKAKWFVVAYALIELFEGVLHSADGVAHFAHLGGMLFGLLLIIYWRYRSNQYRRW
ncbi:MAG: rhomboid family intramembrane serine protease [Bacteroidales bacterium]|nr:rhomboid family intramembrane serine protease [Candidatus Colimorpha onthohippi]